MAIQTPNQLGLTRLVRAQTGDPALDQILRSVFRAIEELQAAGGVVHENLVLEDNGETQLAHGLGHTPSFVYVSPPRGAVTTGRITETRSTTLDRSKFLQLGAYGFGADVVVDVWVIG